MSRRFLLIGFFILFLGNLFAQDAQTLFRQGNRLYQQGQYTQAVQNYSKILKSGYESGALYFNLGNAYYKLDSLALARVNYERARRFLKNDRALQDNLKLLKMRLVDKIQTPPRLILSVWWNALLGLFSIKTLSWIVVGLFWLTLLLAGLRQYFLKRRRQERFKTFFITLLFIFIFLGLVLAQKIYRNETQKFAVVLKPKVTLFAEPNRNGTEVFILHSGTEVKINRSNGRWLEVMLIDGKTGWLERKFLEII